MIINGELLGIWKEAIATYLSVLSWDSPGENQENKTSANNLIA
jgi:hypothetical protein